jgi:hypothetical protein
MTAPRRACPGAESSSPKRPTQYSTNIRDAEPFATCLSQSNSVRTELSAPRKTNSRRRVKRHHRHGPISLAPSSRRDPTSPSPATIRALRLGRHGDAHALHDADGPTHSPRRVVRDGNVLALRNDGPYSGASCLRRNSPARARRLRPAALGRRVILRIAPMLEDGPCRRRASTSHARRACRSGSC